MKTRINLYLEELKPKREFLTLTNVAICWAALIVVLVIVVGVFGHLNQTSKERVLVLQSQLDQGKNQLTQAQQALERKQDKSPLLRRIEKKKEEIQEKQRLLDFMLTKTAQAKFDYAQVMTDLAGNTHREVWLKEFKFVGDEITLVGAATHGSAIPEWLNGLKDTDYFSAKAFSLLEFEKQKEGVEFQVATKLNGSGGQ
ncbi:PilN domain-containing protein [Pseudoalteromonas sp. SSM20]|uniref:PilN domain-containing protein n=1 Tax=Pseudoalteromonas sp. SSM20 TaxID=3139394 RepID=UPI003BAD2951